MTGALPPCKYAYLTCACFTTTCSDPLEPKTFQSEVAMKLHYDCRAYFPNSIPLLLVSSST
eukprot:3918737-Amphidinium_carterae.1